MAKLIAFSGLALASVPALAVLVPPTQVPSPGILPLLGIGVLAVMAARRFKR